MATVHGTRSLSPNYEVISTMRKIKKNSQIKTLFVVILLSSATSCSYLKSTLFNAEEDAITIAVPNFTLLDPLFDIGFEGNLKSGILAYNEKRYEAALRDFYPLAKAENADSEYYLGLMYVNGQGLSANAEEGSIWLLRAANRGNVKAQYLLGQMYINGIGISKSIQTGIRWHLTAARQGYPPAQFNMGSLYQQGKVPIESNLVALYNEEKTRAFEYEQAAKWYRAAAEQGYAAAQNNLGYLYMKGLGVAQNYTNAATWFGEAAGQGQVNSQYHLASLYENGYSVPFDLDQALFWLRKSASSGFRPAEKRIPVVEALMKQLGASFILFGEPLSSFTRSILRDLIKESNGTPLREEEDYWYDVYESAKILADTDRLFLGYSIQTNQLGKVTYRFPAYNNNNQVVEVIKMIRKKYGVPLKSVGDLRKGMVDYRWKVKDALVSVTRRNDQPTVFLNYVLEEPYRVILEEMSKAEEQEFDFNLKFEVY